MGEGEADVSKREAIFLAERDLTEEGEPAASMHMRRFIYRMEPPILLSAEGNPIEICCVTSHQFHTNVGLKWKASLFAADHNWQIVRGRTHLFRLVEEMEIHPDRVMEAIGYVPV